MNDNDADFYGPYLHWSFMGSVILLPSVQLNSLPGFLLGSLLTIAVCLTERLLTFAGEKQWVPSKVKASRFKFAAWKALSYWIVTFLRLMYMLIAMSLHLGIIVVIVTTLATAQFFIEFHKDGDTSSRLHLGVREPLLEQGVESPYPLSLARTRRHRPDRIYIPPSDSNLALAGVVPVQMDLTSSSSTAIDEHPCDDVVGWEKESTPHRAEQYPFRISDEDEDTTH
ncbi:hypothetical protein ONZ45_g4211 [Pleurotus djamor]|nr:hypothetical protein ONZ45_g4211 [Pleurotus djamor]